MRVSTKGRYAIRFMLDLALHNTGEPVRIKDVSGRQGISDKYLEQVVSILSQIRSEIFRSLAPLRLILHRLVMRIGFSR